MKKRTHNRLYVGIKPGSAREVFRTPTEPTSATHGHLYNAAIGPFRTKRGALYMAAYGGGNPHCRCVAEAERLAAIHAGQSTLAADYDRQLARAIRHPSVAEMA